MNKEEYKEFIESTVYHELGHVLGYVLANKKPETALGPIKIIRIGELNLVTPIKSYYHIVTDINQDIPRLKEATENIERTIAWFIEVILGCSLQTIFEEKPFRMCFAPKLDGGLDFKNISNLKLGSSFRWNIQEIYKLQNDLEKILIKKDITASLNNLVEKILSEVINQENREVIYIGNEIDSIIKELEKLISHEFYEDYCALIDKYKEVFTKKYDLKCEILLHQFQSKKLEYDSGHCFSFNLDEINLEVEGIIRFIHKEIAKSGENFIGEILFTNKRLVKNSLRKMMKIDIIQDSECVGIATIMNVLNKDLEIAST